MNRQGNDEVPVRLHMGCGESLCSRLLLRVPPPTKCRASSERTRETDRKRLQGRART